MTDFARFVAPVATPEKGAIEEASACLDRFTLAFNACDTTGMDAQLAFPHSMLSGADRLEWAGPGQHPTDFFDRLKASGWARTEYESKQAVLATGDKVHFVVTYTRQNAAGEILSIHENLWIALRTGTTWGIALRSY